MLSQECRENRRAQHDMAVTQSLQDFLLSLPKITQLSYRAHILLVAYYLRNAGQTNFSQQELSEEFELRAGLPKPPYLDDRLRQFSKGKTAPLVKVGGGRYSLSIPGLEEVNRYLETTPATPHPLEH